MIQTLLLCIHFQKVAAVKHLSIAITYDPSLRANFDYLSDKKSA